MFPIPDRAVIRDTIEIKPGAVILIYTIGKYGKKIHISGLWLNGELWQFCGNCYLGWTNGNRIWRMGFWHWESLANHTIAEISGKFAERDDAIKELSYFMKEYLK